jgi:hypothetical protein
MPAFVYDTGALLAAERGKRAMGALHLLATDEQLARAAGTACGPAHTSDVVDALVVVTAAVLDATVITSDPDDLRHLADAIAAKIVICAV